MYALRPPGAALDNSSPGIVQSIDGNTVPTASGNTFLPAGNHSGTIYGKADAGQGTVTLPPFDLTASNMLSQSGLNAHPAPDSSGVRIVPTTNQCYIPAGLWALQSDNGKGDQIQVYDFSGNPINVFQGQTNLGSQQCFSIYDYQLQIPPGTNLVVDSSAIGVSATGKAQGNFMLTLSPVDFPNSTDSGNFDPNTGKFVLPILGMGYGGTDQIGTMVNGQPESAPASLTLGGSLYVQGQVVGQGVIVAQKNTPSPDSWVPPIFASTWMLDAADHETPPPSGDSGDIHMSGNAQLLKSPTFAVTLYSEGGTEFTPTTFRFDESFYSPNPNVPADFMPFVNALNDVAQGSCAPSGCSGGLWTNPIPNIGESLDYFIDYGHNQTYLTTLMRNTQNGGSTGLDNGNTGTSPQSLFGATTSDSNLMSYFGGSSVPGTPMSLYQYTILSNYKMTGDSTWLSYQFPQASNSTAPLDPVEMLITSRLNSWSQMAYMNNVSGIGNFTYSQENISMYNDITFQGFVYAKGNAGFMGDAPGRFGFQGAIVAPQGGLTVGDGVRYFPYQVNFIYDPFFIAPYYAVGTSGAPISIQWIVVQ